MTDVKDPIPALKSQLRRKILALVGHWEQYTAAGALGTTQPRMSNLKHDRLERFSLERLIRFLAEIEQTVEIKVVGPARPRIFRFHRTPRGPHSTK
jgi:predicted XRE-type DNA-binding protein